MLDDDNTTTPDSVEDQAAHTQAADPAPAKKAAAKKAPARKTAKKAVAATADEALLELPEQPVKKAAAKKAPAKKAAAKKTTAKKAVVAPAETAAAEVETVDAVPVAAELVSDATDAPAKKAAAKKTAAKKTTKKAAAKKAVRVAADEAVADVPTADAGTTTEAPAGDAEEAPAKKPAAKRTRARKAAVPVVEQTELEEDADTEDADEASAAVSGVVPLFQAPEAPRTRRRAAKPAPEVTAEPVGADAGDADAEGSSATDSAAADEAAADEAAADEAAPVKSRRRSRSKAKATDEANDEAGETSGEPAAESHATEASEQTGDESGDDESADDDESGQGGRRRRRRGGRRRRKSSDAADHDSHDGHDDESGSTTNDDATTDSSDDESAGDEDGGGSRRRRRRRRSGDNGDNGSSDDPANTVTRVRQARSAEDQITAVAGSTRLEAKKQRRREGREAGRRRAPIVSEAEFLARREAVDRIMVVRQRDDLTQIGVLEDKVLVEHYVSRESQNSLIGNVYVGRVQNVLPSMEAAFVDIGKGRNAVLYAGEVNWSALGHKEGQPRKIESVLSSGQAVLVQVTKDPIGHKGARLTSQISLAGRFLVYVPDGTTSGISRKLPDTERARLKTLLKEIVPETASVIVRTAAEGASEDELTRDVERLKARWEDIEAKSSTGNGPKLLYGEPDLTLKVVRDLFTEDFASLVVEGDEAWDTVHGYVEHMAPDLLDRLQRFEPAEDGRDSFSAHRIDEQIAKGVDRKVWLPSGGSLIIDRTEAMTVVDVNTGKFTGSGGNLEETVTKNNLEAAEEIVRQLRLRDIGGIIVVDFIDMVLESNRDLVLRRLVECLGRDRTRHQVAEVTSLGLVQMTRKRIGTGLLEAFSENCEHCQGRGIVVHEMPIEARRSDDEGRRGASKRTRGGSGGKGHGNDQPQQSSQQRGGQAPKPVVPSPKDIAATARPEASASDAADQVVAVVEAAEPAPVERPAVTTRSRRGRRGAADKSNGASGSEVAAETNAVATSDRVPAESARGEVEQSATTAAAPSQPEPAQPEPARSEPAQAAGATGVVTRTRTRRAARSGGVITPKQSEPIVVAAAPVAAPVAESVDVPTPPKVVTRTRGRRGAAAESDQNADHGDQSDAAELHVPIKKRGARKR